MEGGGFQSGGGTGGLELSNIGDYRQVDDLYTVGNATLFVLFLTIVLSRLTSIGGVSLNAYFSTFGLEGVLSNTALVVLLFQIARYFYSTFYASYGKRWSPLVFVSVLLLVQLLHDVLFYYGAINVLPRGKNEMIDMLKDYAKEHQARAVGGHVTFLTLIAFVAMITKDMSDVAKTVLFAGLLYAIPYSLSMLWTPAATAAPKPPAKREGFKDIRGLN